jgi:hypothetical protein
MKRDAAMRCETPTRPPAPLAAGGRGYAPDPIHRFDFLFRAASLIVINKIDLVCISIFRCKRRSTMCGWSIEMLRFWRFRLAPVKAWRHGATGCAPKPPRSANSCRFKCELIGVGERSHALVQIFDDAPDHTRGKVMCMYAILIPANIVAWLWALLE